MAAIRVTRIHTAVHQSVERGGSKRRPWTRGLQIAHVPSLFHEFFSFAGWIRSVRARCGSAAAGWAVAKAFIVRTRLHGGRYSYISSRIVLFSR
jgi:hypothetical protein